MGTFVGIYGRSRKIYAQRAIGIGSLRFTKIKHRSFLVERGVMPITLKISLRQRIFTAFPLLNTLFFNSFLKILKFFRFRGFKLIYFCLHT